MFWNYRLYVHEYYVPKTSEYNERHGFIIENPINNQWQISRTENSAGEILTVLLSKKMKCVQRLPITSVS